jgi:hypothetical protein
MADLFVCGEMKLGNDAIKPCLGTESEGHRERQMTGLLLFNPLAEYIVRQKDFTVAGRLDTGKDNIVHVTIPRQHTLIMTNSR